MTVSPLVYCSAHFFAVGMAGGRSDSSGPEATWQLLLWRYFRSHPGRPEAGFWGAFFLM